MLNHQQQQMTNIIMITFWEQFAVYAFNTILILFLTHSVQAQGLGYTQAKAYTFIGNSQAIGYLVPMIGGYLADHWIGTRRGILIGCILVAFAYLGVMLSGYTIQTAGDRFFIAAYAFIPAANLLLMTTTTSLVAKIYAHDVIKAKAAMTYYYMAINVGAFLATLIAPWLFASHYGPFSVLVLTFVGKLIATINFAYRYHLYDDLVQDKDKAPVEWRAIVYLIVACVAVYGLTWLIYTQLGWANWVILSGCGIGILLFLIKTFTLPTRTFYKQLVACILMLEAIVFFVVYNQMNTTLILCAAKNAHAYLFHIPISPAHYQMLNPLLIILLGFSLPRFYKKWPRFTIPYQFATGTLLAGLASLVMVYGSLQAQDGFISGYYIALTFILITLGELFISAIGLSMIGMYCDKHALNVALGVWFLASSLSNALSGRIAGWAAVPETLTSPWQSLAIYQHYYAILGGTVCFLGGVMVVVAFYLHRMLKKQGIPVH